MTTFKEPLRVGNNTGNASTDTRGFTILNKEVTFSASALSANLGLPSGNNVIRRATAVVTTPPAGIAAGIDIELGDDQSATKFGEIAVSASGATDLTLVAQEIGSAGTTLVVRGSAQTSGGDLTSFGATIYVDYVAKG